MDRRDFAKWFAGAVATVAGGAAVAGKADGLAGYMFPDKTDAHIPPFVKDPPRDLGFFGKSQVLSTSINMRQNMVDVTSIGGPRHAIAGRPPEVTLNVRAVLEPEHMSLMREMEPVNIDMTQLFARQLKNGTLTVEQLGIPKDAAWLMTSCQVNFGDANGLMTCDMEFVMTQQFKRSPQTDNYEFDGDS